MTLLYSDPIFLDHDTGPSHPESAARLQSITQHLTETGLIAQCHRGFYSPLDTSQLLEIHSTDQVALVKTLASQGGGMVDPDTVVSASSFNVACMAAGAALAAVDAVVKQEDTTAACLIRPPGHHATAERSMGFCLFNNIALAAHHARHTYGLDRLLIVDWDVHHGNGTQAIFYSDPTVFYMSIHRYPFYPGTGAASETGIGKGLGYTLNLPIAYGTSRQTYLQNFKHGLETAAKKINPQLILISAGFDAHREDPIGSLDLDTSDFATMTQDVLDIAKAYSSIGVISCLEGGYNTTALAHSVAAHLTELLRF